MDSFINFNGLASKVGSEFRAHREIKIPPIANRRCKSILKDPSVKLITGAAGVESIPILWSMSMLCCNKESRLVDLTTIQRFSFPSKDI